jgi:hypothetical protein
MTDDELLKAALPWVQELLRRNMLGVLVSEPPTPVTPPKTAQAWPEPDDYQVMEDHVLLFVDYAWDETIDHPQTPHAANSSRKLSPVST